MSQSLESRLETLEARLLELEDRAAIMQLIASYGPAADTCSQGVIAGLWTDNGIYSVVGTATYEGKAAVGALVENATHQDYVRRGCSQVFARDGDYWRVDRASANRWELVRTPDGWRVAARYNHLMDGSESSRDLLRQVVAPA